MLYLLDANAVISLMRGEPGLTKRMTAQPPSHFGLSAIVAHELYYGAFRSQRSEQGLARIDALRFEVVAFDAEDALAAGRIRAELARAGSPIGAYDVLIAAQAQTRDLVLITHNHREFGRVSGLKWEDWQEG